MIRNKGSTSSGADICALRKQWDEVTCPICMDHPHNAVLLLCDSHDRGCRAYICDTSYRHSNCLDRFKRLRSNYRSPVQANSSFLEISGSERLERGSMLSGSVSEGLRMRGDLIETHESLNLGENGDPAMVALGGNRSHGTNRSLEAQGQENMNIEESITVSALEPNDFLKCPLCRGKVLGWKVVEEARQYLDLKPRSCSRESCSFSGNYGELRRHARRIHPATRPADVDPSRQRAWRHLEHQHDYGDMLSAIRSTMPGAIVLGDYVIENAAELSRDLDISGSNDANRPWWTSFLLFHVMSHPLGSFDEPRRSSRPWRTHRRSSRHRNPWSRNALGIRHANHVRGRDDDDGDVPTSRRQRRFTRSRHDEELP